MLKINSRLYRLSQIALLSIASLAASGCSGFNAPANAPMPAPAAKTSSAAIEVSIISAAYKPKTLRTKVGTSVKWLNKDYEAHTVTADDSSFSSSILDRNRSWKHTFAKPGKYPYHCKIHPYMTGTVVVTK